MNTLYVKQINGMKVVKQRKDIVLKKNTKIPSTTSPDKFREVTSQVFNPTHEMLIKDGWIIYEKPKPTEKELLEESKQNKINLIREYDSSNNVNVFYIKNIPVWIDKPTRAGLKLRFEAEIAKGETNTILWYDNMQFPLSLEKATHMLYAIEIYASACYDNTQLHIAKVNELTSINDVETYDFKIGYPEKLRF